MSDFLQNLLNKAKKKADDLEKGHRPDSKKKSIRPDTPTVSDTSSGPDTVSVSDIISVSDTLNVPDAGLQQSSNSILSTYVTLLSQINKRLPHMTPSELRLYIYLVTNSSDGIFPYNQRNVMKSVGLGSHTTVVKALSSLQKKNLIKWISKSNKKSEQSKLKVILPHNLSSIE
jgi:hypothetical protein